MPTLQDQYITAVRESQETWAGVVDTFTENLQKPLASPGAPLEAVDPTAAIDQVFDFWAKALEAQRDVSKQLVSLAVAAADKARTQAESVSSAVREQAETAARAAREQVESAQAIVREQAAEQATERYADLTKAELQDDLARRDLPKTGNVDELRERLIADDQK